MSDWKHLSAGAQLDNLIAERLVVMGELYKEYMNADAYEEKMREHPEERYRPAKEWLILWDVPGEQEAFKQAPLPYSQCVDDALKLPLPPRHWYVLYGPAAKDDTWDVELYNLGNVFEREEADTCALAICQTWLAFKDTEDAT